MFAFGAAATNMPSPINGDGADTAAPSAAVVAEDSVTMSPLPGAAAIDATLDVPPAAAAASASAAPSGTGGATAASGTRATASLGEGTGNADAQLSASKAKFYDLLCEKEGKSKGAKGAKYLTREEYDYATSVVTDWQPMVKHDAKDYKIKEKFYAGQGVAGNSLCVKANGKKVVVRDELFDVIYAAHKQLAHCRTAKTVKKTLDGHWYGITNASVQLCLNVCAGCVAKKAKITASIFYFLIQVGLHVLLPYMSRRPVTHAYLYTCCYSCR